ncbi:hypothetical protein ACFWIB_39095 [Streptomyces sp. NPDC127051]|uniref:hypothetical protein n=1 Tax=Streptomyces sp. NPDC127051 TaxID=3347119 RepID=UPI003659CDE3
MDLEMRGHLFVDPDQEFLELGRTVSAVQGADDLTGGDVERGSRMRTARQAKNGGFPLIVGTGCYAAVVSAVDRCSQAMGLVWPRRE